jgi:HTH-type transcriptional regulator/antitoxin HigA
MSDQARTIEKNEVLSGKRGLSIQMIRRLHRGLGIPLEVLIAEPKRASV